MIHLYSGTPGSGKSLHTARDIRDALRIRKMPVIANFDVNHSLRNYDRLFTYLPNDRLDPSFLEDFARNWFAGRKVREDSILLVIDEAQLVFNSRAWQHGQRMDWIQFFSQHRHFGYKVVLIAQFDRMIDRQIRSLIEIETNHRKLGNFGMKGLILSLPFRGRLFLGVSYYYGLKEKVSTCWLLPRWAYFTVFHRYNRFETGAGP